MNQRKRREKREGILDQLLGFTPSQELIEWVYDNYYGKVVPYNDVERMFLLDVHPNYQSGVVLSIFDLCQAKVQPQKEIDLPPVDMSSAYSGGGRSFIDDYIREISIFPTLNREQELELAKLMEVAYIRYKSSLCFCPAILDLVNERIDEVRSQPTGEHHFHMARLKKLVIPGASNLSYPQLWNMICHQWNKVMTLRQKIKVLGRELGACESPSKEKSIELLTYKAAASFVLKDLNIKESVFHKMRERLDDIEADYPGFEMDFQRVRRCYDRYIECKNLMVNYNLKLVVSIARKFFRSKVSPMDVIQYGNEGLIRAAEDYNYKLKFKFSTYAIWWIRQKIQEGVQEQEHMIRIPAYRLHLNRKYNAIKERLSQEGEGVVSDEELSKELDLTVDQIKKLRQDPSAFVIAPSSDSDSEDGGNVLEQLEDTRTEGVDGVYDEDATQALKSHLRLYPVRERFILALRYGLDCEEISPIHTDEGKLEERFSAFEEGVSDKDVDHAMEPIPYRFDQLSTEIKITQEQLKLIKSEQRVDLELAQSIYPFTLEELGGWRDEADGGALEDVRGKTVLAMVDGRDYAEYIKAKARDRLVLSKVWLEMALAPSVVKKMVNHEGLILEEVARVFGLTKERVRQLEAKVLRNISFHLVLP